MQLILNSDDLFMNFTGQENNHQGPLENQSPSRKEPSNRKSPQRSIEPDTRFSPSPISNSPTTRTSRHPDQFPAGTTDSPVQQQEGLPRQRTSDNPRQYQPPQTPTIQTEYKPIESPPVAQYVDQPADYESTIQPDFTTESSYNPQPSDEPQAQLYDSTSTDHQYQPQEYDQQQYSQQGYDQNYANAEYPTDHQQYDPQSGYDQQQYDDQQYQQQQYETPINEEYSGVQPEYQPQSKTDDEPSQSSYAQPSPGNGTVGQEYPGSTTGITEPSSIVGDDGSTVGGGKTLLPK